jgi:hypothetical protein
MYVQGMEKIIKTRRKWGNGNTQMFTICNAHISSLMIVWSDMLCENWKTGRLVQLWRTHRHALQKGTSCSLPQFCLYVIPFIPSHVTSHCSVFKLNLLHTISFCRARWMNFNPYMLQQYSCEECGDSFRQQFNMRPHLRIYCGEWSCSWDVCKKFFSHQGHLKTQNIQTG